MENINMKMLRAICKYVIITATIILIILQILTHLPLVGSYVSGFASGVWSVLGPITGGFVIMYIMQPVILFYERLLAKCNSDRIKAHSRGIGVILAIITVLAVLCLLISLLVFNVTNQFQIADFEDASIVVQRFFTELDSFYNAVMEKLATLDINTSQKTTFAKSASEVLFNAINGAIGDISVFVGNLSGNITSTVFAIIIAIYFMVDGKRIGAFLCRTFSALARTRTIAYVSDCLNDLNSAFAGYLKGQLGDVLFMMVAVSVVLSITGCRFAIVIGVLSGVSNLIPYFGPIIGYGLTAIVCTIYGDFRTLFISILALLVLQFVDGNIVGPRLLASSIKIHPLLVVLFLMTGSAIGGLLGMLLAVPVGSFLKVRFMKWLAYKETRNGRGESPQAAQEGDEL